MRYLVIAGFAAALMAAVPAGVAVWKSSELQAKEKALTGKVNAQKVATGTLGSFGNHSLMLSYREGDGEAELHETQNDIFFIQKGTATLVLGGTVVNPKNTAPNEIRGASIKGGEKRALGPGDMVHIPAKVPHQLLLTGDKHFTYTIIKIDAK